jgi:hypothetical protein
MEMRVLTENPSITFLCRPDDYRRSPGQGRSLSHRLLLTGVRIDERRAPVLDQYCLPCECRQRKAVRSKLRPPCSTPFAKPSLSERDSAETHRRGARSAPPAPIPRRNNKHPSKSGRESESRCPEARRIPARNTNCQDRRNGRLYTNLLSALHAPRGEESIPLGKRCPPLERSRPWQPPVELPPAAVRRVSPLHPPWRRETTQ